MPQETNKNFVLDKNLTINYSQDVKQGILNLMSLVPYKNLIWQWQFEENPYCLPFQPIVINHADNIIGFNGEMEIKILYKGKSHNAIWSCDFFVHADYRGKGIGKYMKEIQFNSSNLVMAFGLSDSAVSIWKNRSCLPNKDICALRKYRSAFNFKRLSWSFYQTLKYIKGRNFRIHNKSYRYEILDSLGDKRVVNDLWESIGISYKKTVVRNYNYLHWRYENHPLAKYQFIHIFNSEKLEAIGVFRKYKSDSYFVDMVVNSSNAQARTELIAGWLKLHASSDIYHCVSTDQLLQKCLMAHGFHKTRNKQWFFVHSINKDDLNPENDWFIMSGDSDGEFLKAASDCYKEMNKEEFS
ncbi:MAG: GNAT family N-acetyltransferase [Gammaproteobacteria bacterium]|nr:GNAT family N-acetyltransferase [Gammaproteobacteria bacterium]